MKLLFLVLALALFANLGFAQDAWTTLKSKEYKKGLVKDLAKDGAEFVIDTNIASGALSNTDFDFDSISKAEKQSVEDGTNYRFTVIINDDETKAEARFIVYHPNKGKDEITSSSLNFHDRMKHGEDGGLPGQNAWNRVSLSKFNKDEDMVEAFDEGLDFVIDQGIAHGLLPNSSFEISEPDYRAKVKVRNGGYKYRFQVQFSSEEGTAKAAFVVYRGKVVSYYVDHNNIVVPEPEPEVPEEAEESIEESPEESAPEEEPEEAGESIEESPEESAPEEPEVEAPEAPETEAPEEAEIEEPEQSGDPLPPAEDPVA